MGLHLVRVPKKSDACHEEKGGEQCTHSRFRVVDLNSGIVDGFDMWPFHSNGDTNDGISSNELAKNGKLLPTIFQGDFQHEQLDFFFAFSLQYVI